MYSFDYLMTKLKLQPIKWSRWHIAVN